MARPPIPVMRSEHHAVSEDKVIRVKSPEKPLAVQGELLQELASAFECKWPLSRCSSGWTGTGKNRRAIQDALPRTSNFSASIGHDCQHRGQPITDVHDFFRAHGVGHGIVSPLRLIAFFSQKIAAAYPQREGNDGILRAMGHEYG